jgi:hypothetical protein
MQCGKPTDRQNHIGVDICSQVNVLTNILSLSIRYYTTASVNGSILYVILPQSSIVNSSDSGCVLMPFIRSTNLAKILKTVEVLGVSQPLSYILNETGLYVNFSFPPAQLYSYWSQGMICGSPLSLYCLPVCLSVPT